MPIGSGLGSSAASTVAGLFAINTLLGDPLSREELLPFAVRGAELACGHGHADNVAPALMGGITLLRGYDPLDVVKLPAPTFLFRSEARRVGKECVSSFRSRRRPDTQKKNNKLK